MNKKKKIKKIIDILIMSLACLIVELGFYFFLLPAGLVTGGVMGISVILQNFGIKPSYIIYGLNGIFLILALIFLGKKFFIKTIYLSILAPSFVFLLDNILKVPYDLIFVKILETPMLLSAVMGGILVGLGLGLTLRYGGSTGGMDVLQKIISKYTHMSFTKAMYLSDGLIIVGGFIFYLTGNNYESIFLAVLSMVISGIIIDVLSISGRSGFTYFIISSQHEEIRSSILTQMERGITIIAARGGYTNQARELLVCNILKKEKISMDLLINKIDPKAFVFIVESKEILGYGFSKNQEAFLENILKEQNDKSNPPD
ncbi:MAG: YitT family protein [Acholeplasmatales bacterium]|jgi:uncharacterized membrane-anchored protein YitT (DUF2179 family)|nr:YitT family protein [Acholeplasmatales bacterium]